MHSTPLPNVNSFKPKTRTTTTKSEDNYQSVPEDQDECHNISCRSLPRHPCCNKPSQYLELVPQTAVNSAQDVPKESYRKTEKLVKGHIEDDDEYDVEMCQILKVPCHSVPKHPCCQMKLEKSDAKSSTKMENVEHNIETPDLSYDGEEKIESDSLDQIKHEIVQKCQQIKVPCHSIPDHPCCQMNLNNFQNVNESKNMAKSSKKYLPKQTTKQTTIIPFETTLSPKEETAKKPGLVEDIAPHDHSLCQNLKVPCHAVPKHPCCQNALKLEKESSLKMQSLVPHPEYNYDITEEDLEAESAMDEESDSENSMEELLGSDTPTKEDSDYEENMDSERPVEEYSDSESSVEDRSDTENAAVEDLDSESSMNRRSDFESTVEEDLEPESSVEADLDSENTMDEQRSVENGDIQMCSYLRVSCNSHPDHYCCKDDELESKNFDFPRTEKPKNNNRFTPKVPDIKAKKPIKLDAEQHYQMACKSVNIPCEEHPNHPCCKMGNMPKETTSKFENKFENTQEFDFSRIASRTTPSVTPSPTKKPSMEASYHNLQSFQNELKSASHGLESSQQFHKSSQQILSSSQQLSPHISEPSQQIQDLSQYNLENYQRDSLRIPHHSIDVPANKKYLSESNLEDFEVITKPTLFLGGQRRGMKPSKEGEGQVT